MAVCRRKSRRHLFNLATAQRRVREGHCLRVGMLVQLRRPVANPLWCPPGERALKLLCLFRGGGVRAASRTLHHGAESGSAAREAKQSQSADRRRQDAAGAGIESVG